MAATPSPNYSDQQLLSSDATFQNRVRQSLLTACAAIKSEAVTTAFHRERETYVQGVMNAADSYKLIFAQAVATNSSVISDATVAGATPLTSGNVATQAALVTDPHIDTAVSSLFNAFFRTPAS
jgi:hypothetical protein